MGFIRVYKKNFGESPGEFSLIEVRESAGSPEYITLKNGVTIFNNRRKIYDTEEAARES